MRTLTLALALGLLADCAGEGVNDGYVRLVLLPDTQCYARFSPVVMEAQARFIQAEQQRTNIVHVAHLGDITDLGTEEEWQRARSALAPLFGQVSMTLVSGNHDLGENGSANTRASRIDSTFAPAELMVSGTFDGGVQNSFTLVEDELLVLGLEFAPRAAVGGLGQRCVGRVPRALRHRGDARLSGPRREALRPSRGPATAVRASRLWNRGRRGRARRRRALADAHQPACERGAGGLWTRAAGLRGAAQRGRRWASRRAADGGLPAG
jgi:3',5'-cyclic AMP phosphodiesterase CpdA